MLEQWDAARMQMAGQGIALLHYEFLSQELTSKCYLVRLPFPSLHRLSAPHSAKPDFSCRVCVTLGEQGQASASLTRANSKKNSCTFRQLPFVWRGDTFQNLFTWRNIKPFLWPSFRKAWATTCAYLCLLKPKEQKECQQLYWCFNFGSKLP